MRKAKIMLLSICLMATTGGVLAFKAMTPADYCVVAATFTTTQVGGPMIWTCHEFGIPLICDRSPWNTVITATTATVNFFCYTNADIDAQPCREGNQPSSPLKRCPIKGTATIEIEE